MDGWQMLAIASFALGLYQTYLAKKAEKRATETEKRLEALESAKKDAR